MNKGLDLIQRQQPEIIDGFPTGNIYIGVTKEELTELKNELKEHEQYKAIEQELGVDLVTLFKALKCNEFYSKHPETGEVSWIALPELYYCGRKWNIGCGSMIFNEQEKCCDSWDCDPKDYGKTWALTREELEKLKR